jgi:hypothetical protein
MLVWLIAVCSLPKDQDCHEMWSKKRRKILRESARNEQALPPGVKTEIERSVLQAIDATEGPPSQPPKGPSTGDQKPSITDSKSRDSLGLTASLTADDSKQEVIPGLDMLSSDGVFGARYDSRASDNSKLPYSGSRSSDSRQPTTSASAGSLSRGNSTSASSQPVLGGAAVSADLQQQLKTILGALDTGPGGQLTVSRLAQLLNIPVNAATQALLENLALQLVLATTASQLRGSDEASRGGRVYGNVPSFRDPSGAPQQNTGEALSALLSQLIAQQQPAQGQGQRPLLVSESSNSQEVRGSNSYAGNSSGNSNSAGKPGGGGGGSSSSSFPLSSSSSRQMLSSTSASGGRYSSVGGANKNRDYDYGGGGGGAAYVGTDSTNSPPSAANYDHHDERALYSSGGGGSSRTEPTSSYRGSYESYGSSSNDNSSRGGGMASSYDSGDGQMRQTSLGQGHGQNYHHKR